VKNLLRKLMAASAVLFMVAGLSLATSTTAHAQTANCTTGDLDVTDGKVVIDNGSTTHGDLSNTAARRVDITGTSPWAIQNASMVIITDQGINRRVNFFNPGDIHYQLKTDEVRLSRLVVATNAPLCGNQSPSGSSGCGYYLMAKDGGVFTYGSAKFFGSTGNLRLNQPVFGGATTKSGNGYWLVAYDGGIFSFGDAKFFGSTGGMRLNQPIAGMSRTASGNGYWLVARDGGIFSFGDAKFFGSTGGTKLSSPVIGMITTQSGNGYWIVTANAQVFAFGDAARYNAGGFGTIVGGVDTGDGYRLVNTLGDVYTVTSAGPSSYSAPSGLRSKVVGVANDPDSTGFWEATADGSVVPTGGSSSYCGSASNLRLNQPIVNIIAVGKSS
jgi:hypothetical protein